jgi:hypothetical protein
MSNVNKDKGQPAESKANPTINVDTSGVDPKASSKPQNLPPNFPNPATLADDKGTPGQLPADLRPLSQNADDIPDPPPAAATTPEAMAGADKSGQPLFANIPAAAFDPPASKAATGRPVSAEHEKQLKAAQQPKVDFRQDGVDPNMKLKLFEVSLKDNPKYVVAADERLSAIETYKRNCGIIKTENDFSVTQVGQEQ